MFILLFSKQIKSKAIIKIIGHIEYLNKETSTVINKMNDSIEMGGWELIRLESEQG